MRYTIKLCEIFLYDNVNYIRCRTKWEGKRSTILVGWMVGVYFLVHSLGDPETKSTILCSTFVQGRININWVLRPKNKFKLLQKDRMCQVLCKSINKCDDESGPHCYDKMNSLLFLRKFANNWIFASWNWLHSKIPYRPVNHVSSHVHCSAFYPYGYE